ncbi:MAG: hypothetical protein VB100_08730 [Angelakisella sp.]|nr:hypothetical protein [Angelakisella sp.]
MYTVPGIASSDYLNLKGCIDFADKEYGKLHLTIADGHFVPRITFGMRAALQICQYAKSRISFHMLVTNPLQYLDEIALCYPDIVFLHLTSMPFPLEVIRQFRAKGVPVGLALTPAEDPVPLRYLMGEVDAVLQMTYEPNEHEFLESLYPKIDQLVKTGLPVWLDGGITDAMVHDLEKRGAAALVMGSSLFRRKA